jgi:hypothetical protein
MSSDELAWSSEVPGDSEETDTSSSSWSSSGSSSNLSGSLDDSESSSAPSDAQHPDVDLETEAATSSDQDSDQYDGDDDEDSLADNECASEDDHIWPARSSLGRRVLGEIKAMYANRYEAPRNGLPRGPSYLRHVLTVQKAQRVRNRIVFKQLKQLQSRFDDSVAIHISDDSPS